MNKELYVQVIRVTNAQHEVRIKDDRESRIKLSYEILKLNEISPLNEEKIMKLRETYGLKSLYWVPAELKLIMEKE